MRAKAEYLEFITDQMAGFAPVRVRRMFGGAGIFRGDVMIGLVADDTLYLRTDAETVRRFAARGLEPFTYRKLGKPVAMAYRRAPQECLDDVDEMTAWVGEAYRAALRAQGTAVRKEPNARRRGAR